MSTRITPWRARSPPKAWSCSRTTASCRLKNPQHIAVIGRAAENAHFQGGGSSHINPTQVAVPFKEVQQLAGQPN